MYRRLLMNTLIIGAFLLTGCSSSLDSQSPQVMEGWQKQIVDERKPKSEDSLQELYNLKNGVKTGENISSSPGATSSETKKTSPSTLAPGLTAAELQYVITELLNLGYLKTRNPDEKEFNAAIKMLQKDNHLPQTGSLDPATLKLLGL